MYLCNVKDLKKGNQSPDYIKLKIACCDCEVRQDGVGEVCPELTREMSGHQLISALTKSVCKIYQNKRDLDLYIFVQYNYCSPKAY